MDRREEGLLNKIRPERHIAALMTLANLKYIKEECEKNKYCEKCRYRTERLEDGTCCITGSRLLPSDWDIYEIAERMYK